MEAKCSCPVCDTFSCYNKFSQRGLDPYNDTTILSKIHPLIDVDKPLLTADKKIDVIASKEIKNETDDFDEEPEKSIETTSLMTCEDIMSEKLKDFQTPDSKNTLCPSVAKLSAQVMNFPFKGYQSALNQQKVAPQANIAKLTSFDIFEKIKEVYKACSCKVCECIVGKPQTNQVCNCKPCDCEDCNSKGSITISKAFRSIEVAQAEPDYQIFGSGLLSVFVRPDRELNQNCKCKPCECNQCFKNLSTPCKCKRCSCVECEFRYQRKYQNVVVAAVESDNQTRQDCTCTPCHCAECTQRYGASSRIRHEVSTEIIRHLGCHCNTCLNNACAPEGADACTCEKGGNKVVRKPIQRDTDFDIHRSLVTHKKNYMNNNKTKHDQIAMFAAVSKTYPGYQQSNHFCTCGRCSCLYCSSKFAQNSADAVKSSIISMDSLKNDETETLKSDSAALDGKVTFRKSCLKTYIQSDMDNNRPMYIDHNKLFTEIKATNIYSLSSEKSRTCSNDNTWDTCTGDIESKEHEVFYPIKIGEKLTPYIFERKMNKSYIRFCDENEEDYETPAKRARISTNGNLNVPVTKDDTMRRFSFIKYPDINRHKIESTKPKLEEIVEPYGENSNTAELQFSTAFGENASNHIFKFDCLADENANIFSCINILDSTVNNKNYKSNVSFKTNASENDKDTDIKKDCEKLFKVDNLLSDRITSNWNRKHNSSMKNISQTVSSSDKDGRNETVCDENKSICSIKSKRESLFLEDDKCEQSEEQEELKNLFCKDENYKRVERTLKEARDFTQQLMELLSKYEKANKEFQSVYDKLKHQNSTINTFSEHIQRLESIQKKESKDIFHKILIKETNLHKAQDDRLIERENVSQHLKEGKIDQNPNKSLQEQTKPINKESKHKSKINIKSGDSSVDNINKIYPIQDKANLNDTSYSSKTSNDVIIQFREDSLNTLSVDSSFVTDDVIKRENGLNLITEANISPTSPMKYPARNKRRRCKRYSQIYKQAIKRSKLFAPQTPKCSITTGISQDFFENINKTETKKDSKKGSHISSETTGTKELVLENDKTEITQEFNHFAPTSVNYLGTQTFIHTNAEPKNETMKLSENTNNQTKHVASKSNESQVSLGVYRKRSLEKGIKEAVNAIKQASVLWENKYAVAHKTSRGNEALSKLHSEVKKLLELPILQKCEIDTKDINHYHVTNINRKVNSCEALKVSFLAAHRMSDRTTAVTWLAPRLLENVTGYEVLINGRFAKKIQDQTCCETVLDHLPRSDNILLTVRTLTKYRCQSGHAPSSTVVYKPSGCGLTSSHTPYTS